MIELLKSFEPLIKLFESKTRRIIFAVILGIILADVISGFIDGISDSMLRDSLSALGCGGGMLFLGVGLLCVLPDGSTPPMRQSWYVLATIWTVGGTIFLLLFVISLVKMILALF